jgi:hypothetical protein
LGVILDIGACLHRGADRYRLASEEGAETTALAAVGVFGDGGAFGGLYEDPTGAFEGDLE